MVIIGDSQYHTTLRDREGPAVLLPFEREILQLDREYGDQTRLMKVYLGDYVYGVRRPEHLVRYDSVPLIEYPDEACSNVAIGSLLTIVQRNKERMVYIAGISGLLVTANSSVESPRMVASHSPLASELIRQKAIAGDVVYVPHIAKAASQVEVVRVDQTIRPRVELPSQIATS